MAEEICCSSSKEMVKSAEEAATFAKTAGSNAKNMAIKLEEIARKAEEVALICDASQNKSFKSTVKEVLPKVIVSAPAKEVKESLHDVVSTVEVSNHLKSVTQEAKVSVQPSVVPKDNPMADLIKTLEETKVAVSDMKDCCIESSNNTNTLLEKAYHQAKQMDPDTTTGWFDWLSKKSLKENSPKEQKINTNTGNDWFDRFSAAEPTSNEALELDVSKLSKFQTKIHRFSKRIADIMCSEELKYFIGGMSLGVGTGYLMGFVTSKYKTRMVGARTLIADARKRKGKGRHSKSA